MYKTLPDGTLELLPKYDILWKLLRYGHQERIFLPCHALQIPEPVKNLDTSNLILLPEGTQTIIEFDECKEVSVYYVNISEQRLDLACDESGKLLRNVLTKCINLDSNLMCIYILGSSTVNLSFTPIKDQKLVTGGFVLCTRGKNHKLFHRDFMPGSNRYIETMTREFSIVKTLIQKSYRYTSLPLPNSTSEAINCSCSGNMKQKNSELWSITSGSMRAALGVNGEYHGLQLPNLLSKVKVKIDYKIEGSTPVIVMYLKYKSETSTCEIHEDVLGKECSTILKSDSTEVEYTLNGKQFSNVIIYCEVKDYNSYQTNFDSVRYSLDIVSV